MLALRDSRELVGRVSVRPDFDGTIWGISTSFGLGFATGAGGASLSLGGVLDREAEEGDLLRLRFYLEAEREEEEDEYRFLCLSLLDFDFLSFLSLCLRFRLDLLRLRSEDKELELFELLEAFLFL